MTETPPILFGYLFCYSNEMEDMEIEYCDESSPGQDCQEKNERGIKRPWPLEINDEVWKER